MSQKLGNEEVPAMQKFRESILGGMCKGPANRLCKFKVQKEARLEVVRLEVVGGAEVEGWAGPDHEACRPTLPYRTLEFCSLKCLGNRSVSRGMTW